VPVKEFFAVATAVQVAEAVMRLAAVWAYWDSPALMANPAIGLQAVTWGILFWAGLQYWVSLFTYKIWTNSYASKTAPEGKIERKWNNGASIAMHVLAALFNLTQIILTIVVIRQGVLKLDTLGGPTVSGKTVITADLYLIVSQSIFTQYIVVAVLGFFLAFRHFIVAAFAPSAGEPIEEGSVGSVVWKWAPKDFIVVGPQFIFWIEAGLRIICFVSQTANIPDQTLEQSIVSGLWVAQWMAITFQFLSSWAQQDADYVAAVKANGDKVATQKDPQVNLIFGIAVAIAWPLWLTSH
jgi:hypothetical protein